MALAGMLGCCVAAGAALRLLIGASPQQGLGRSLLVVSGTVKAGGLALAPLALGWTAICFAIATMALPLLVVKPDAYVILFVIWAYPMRMTKWAILQMTSTICQEHPILFVWSALSDLLAAVFS